MLDYGDDDDVIQRCRRGSIGARSLGQLSGLPTIEQVDHILSPTSDNDVDLTRQNIERRQVGGFTLMVMANN